MIWHLKEQKPERALKLAGEAGLLPTTAQILISREICTADEVGRFLDATLARLKHPHDLPDMEKAVICLIQAISQKETIGLYADFDADGLTGAAQLKRFLEGLGGKTVIEIPERLRDGYGIHRAGLERLKEAGATVMVTIDCGAKAHDILAEAGVIGLDSIVIDHHSLSERPLPVLAYINPLRISGKSDWKVLCSSGLVFHLIAAIRSRLRDDGYWKTGPVPSLHSYLELAALGTIGDLVPLTGPNRIIVRQGLKQLGLTQHEGLMALKKISDIGGERVGVNHAAYRLCPRINAAGRLGDARTALQLLTTEDSAEALRLASALHTLNRARQEEEGRVLEEALTQAEQALLRTNPAILVLASEGWHPGVVGIVASRIVEKTGRPALVIGIVDGLGRGSGRGVEGINLVELLETAGHHLIKFGGHQGAVGLTMDPAEIAPFATELNRHFRELYPSFHYKPQLNIDAIWQPNDGIERLSAELEKLGPFGVGFPEPRLLFPNMEIKEHRIVGNDHLKLKGKIAGRPIEAIGFRMADKREKLPHYVDLVGIPESNSFNDRIYHTVIIKEFRNSQKI